VTTGNTITINNTTLVAPTTADEARTRARAWRRNAQGWADEMGHEAPEYKHCIAVAEKFESLVKELT
jgi:hypothetical protein